MRRFCLLLALLSCAPVVSQDSDSKKLASLATDIEQPASPTRPAPKGLTLVDLAKQDKRLAGYRAPEGFAVEIVADAPTVVNPVGLAFADDGTPLVLRWVASKEKPKLVEETIAYKDGSKRTIQVVKKANKDVLEALSSSKNDGVWDRAKTILESELPSTVLPFDGHLYLASGGTVRRYEKSKEGKYDKVTTIAKGFAGVGHQQVSGLTIGPDGLLYISCGFGDNVVEGSDGTRATALRTGAIFRCNPDGSKLHTFAIGFRNPYRDVAFDLAGNVFHADNDGGGEGKFVGCRLLHIADGSDYGWRVGVGEASKVDPVRAAAFGELPGKMPGLLKTGKGSPSGLLIYNDSRLPEEYRGLLVMPDLTQQTVRAYRTQAKGASFEVIEEFALLSAPKDPLFRPCQAVLGPDGAIYIVDWRTDPKRGDAYSGDGKNGRIYRLRWAGTKDSPALELRGLDSWSKLAKLDNAKLILALAHPDASDRERVRRELVKRGDKNREVLTKLLVNDDAAVVARIAAVGVLRSMYNDEVRKAFLKALEEGDDELKRVAADALGLCAKKADAIVQDGLIKALSEEDPHVRRAVFLAMGRVAGPGAGDSLATALSFDKGGDVVLRDGNIRALEVLGKPGMSALIALADSGVQKDTDRVVETFLAMRSPTAFSALPTILKHMHVGSAQRADLIRSCVHYQFDPPVSVDPIAEFVAAQKKETIEVKKSLLSVLDTPGIHSGKKSADWARSMLDDDSDEVRTAAIPFAGRTLEGALYSAKLLAKRKLPKIAQPVVAEVLKRHAKQSEEAAKALKATSEE